MQLLESSTRPATMKSFLEAMSDDPHDGSPMCEDPKAMRDADGDVDDSRPQAQLAKAIAEILNDQATPAGQRWKKIVQLLQTSGQEDLAGVDDEDLEEGDDDSGPLDKIASLAPLAAMMM